MCGFHRIPNVCPPAALPDISQAYLKTPSRILNQLVLLHKTHLSPFTVSPNLHKFDCSIVLSNVEVDVITNFLRNFQFSLKLKVITNFLRNAKNLQKTVQEVQEQFCIYSGRAPQFTATEDSNPLRWIGARNGGRAGEQPGQPLFGVHAGLLGGRPRAAVARAAPRQSQGQGRHAPAAHPRDAGPAPEQRRAAASPVLRDRCEAVGRCPAGGGGGPAGLPAVGP